MPAIVRNYVYTPSPAILNLIGELENDQVWIAINVEYKKIENYKHV